MLPRKPKTLAMLLWLTAFVVGMTGCATSPPAETPRTFETFKRFDTDVVEPNALPDLPKGVCVPSEVDCRFIGFDTDGLLALEQFKELARGNTKIAHENAQQAKATAESANELINAGIAQERITAIRVEMLEQERAGRKADAWYYRGLIALLLAIGGFAGAQ